MTIEDVLETDHFIPNSQPSAQSHTIPLPKKSGIRVTRIPAPLLSLITAPSQAPIDMNEPEAQTADPATAPIDFDIQNEPTADPVNAPPQAPNEAQTVDPVTAPIDFGIQNEPDDDLNAPVEGTISLANISKKRSCCYVLTIKNLFFNLRKV